MMSYSVVDPQDNDGVANMASDTMRLRQDGQSPCLDLSEPKHQQNVRQICLSCSMCEFEEASRLALNIKTPHMFSIRKQGTDYCEHCNLPAHNTVSNAAISKVEGCDNLTCFESMHLQSSEEFW